YVAFFFFQAEDGIRDFHVTGVQTCALPISKDRVRRADREQGGPQLAAGARLPRRAPRRLRGRVPERREDQRHAYRDEERAARGRSEERRVGKGCRCRGSPGHDKKRKTRSGE